jgi:serine/threonine protein phosphatase PrpC
MAVFDGHGGADVSDFCIQNLVAAYEAVKEDPTLPNGQMKLGGIFEFLSTRTDEMEAGSTASIVALANNGTEALVGVLGDSPVYVKKADGTIWAAPCHNVRTNPREVDVAQARGGVVYDGYLFDGKGLTAHGIQMSRALGDKDLANVLSREPEIFTVPIDVGSWILVASDGLIDPAHKESNLEWAVIDMIEKGKSARDLVQYALAVPTDDNVSVIIAKVV